jgi:putative ATP-binding cassette transporter
VCGPAWAQIGVSDLAFGLSDESALRQLYELLRPLREAPQRNPLAILTIGLIAAIVLNAVGQVRLNQWQGAFYDALAQRHVPAFLHELAVFLVIVAFLLSLGVAQTWIKQMIRARLREWLTLDLQNAWLRQRRPFWLGFAGTAGTNPDQRIHEDANHLTDLSSDLGIGLLQSSLLLVSFVGVLWGLSDQVAFDIGGEIRTIPGYMVWCAIGYAALGSWLSWRVGRPLVRINADRFQREAEFRQALVRIAEHADGIAVYGGERDEARALAGPFRALISAMVALAFGLARLSWVTAGYGWLAIIVPIIVAAPGYFGGELSFGGLMMVVGAFNQVQSALRWFIDNIAQIADWRATLFRVEGFRAVLETLETLGGDEGRIRIVDHPEGHLRFQDFGVQLTDGAARLEERDVEIGPGERVVILGKARSGKSTAFRAMASLWPWGHGTIYLPPRDRMMFIPQRPYLPVGRLREVLSYPRDPQGFDDAGLRGALNRTGLDHLCTALDESRPWDRALTMDEQQRIAFARVVLHRPGWIFLDEAVDSCDVEHHEMIMSIFKRELPDATVVSMSQGVIDHFYTRELHMARVPDGRPLDLRPDPDAPEKTAPAAAALTVSD